METPEPVREAFHGMAAALRENEEQHLSTLTDVIEALEDGDISKVVLAMKDYENQYAMLAGLIRAVVSQWQTESGKELVLLDDEVLEVDHNKEDTDASSTDEAPEA